MLNADLVLGFCSRLGSADSAGATPVRVLLGPKDSQLPSLHINPQHKVMWAEKEIKDVLIKITNNNFTLLLRFHSEFLLSLFGTRIAPTRKEHLIAPHAQPKETTAAL